MTFREIFQVVRVKALQLFFTKKKQTAFLRTVSDLSDVGISPYNAVKYIAKSEPKNPSLQEICRALLHNMDKGLPFESSLNNWFSKEVSMILSASAGSGSLRLGVDAAVEYLDKQSENVKFFFQQATYPALLCGMSISTTITIRLQVLGNLEKYLRGRELPLEIARFVSVTDFYINRWWVLILGLSISYYLFSFIMNNYTGKYRKYLDMLPVFNFFKEKTAYSVLRSMTILLSNKVGVQQALHLIQSIGGKFQKSHVDMMLKNLQRGNFTIAQIMTSGLIKQEHLNKIELIGFTSGLGKTLRNISDEVFESLLKVQRSLTFIFSFFLYAFAAYNIYVSFSGITAFRELITS